MKYRTNILLLVLALLTRICSGICFAQATPTPPIQVDEQPDPSPGKDDKKGKKTGMVRLWNFSYSEGGQAVFLGAPGDQMPPFDKRLWIARGSKSPEKRNWLEVEPGEYEIFVVADDAVAGNMGVKIGPDAPPSPSLLNQRQGIKIEAKSYQTIILYQKDGHLAARVLDDAAVAAGPGHLRIFTFKTSTKPTVSLLENGGSRKILVQNVGEEGADVELGIQQKVSTLEISYPLTADFLSRQNVELDFRGYRSCSLIFSPDRYGTLSVESSNDAPNLPSTPK